MLERHIASIAVASIACACGGAQPEARRPTELVVPSAEPERAAAPDAGVAPRAQIPELTPDRLPRYMRGNRARALLNVEIEGLESLLSHTKDTSPDYPLLLRRIGMDYVELSMIESSESRAAAARDARATASEYFSRTPAGAANPEPEVLYITGLMQEQAGDLAGAKKIYAQVAAHERADASLKARAHFGLGLLAEGATEAERAYSEAREWLMRLGFQTPEDQVLAQRARERLDALRAGK